MIAVPVADAIKSFYDYRSDADRANPLGCGESYHLPPTSVLSFANMLDTERRAALSAKVRATFL